MKLRTCELLSIHEKHPKDIFSVEIKFDFNTKTMLSITAELVLGDIYFSSVSVELPTNKTEKKCLANYFFNSYRNYSRTEMPEDGVLRYTNYPDRKIHHTRATMYL